MSEENPRYSQPWYVAGIVVAVIVVITTSLVVNLLTYGRAGVASNASVLGNRAVTQQIKQLVEQYEVDNGAHRERNEEAHACLIWLLVRDLRRQGDNIDVTLADDRPCDRYTLPGVVPPLPTTTTTTAPRRTTRTTARHRRQPAATTTTQRRTTAPPPSTSTTTMCVVRVQGDCAP